MAQEQEQQPTPEDLEFEREIAARNPKRKAIVRYDFPDEIDDARAVYMFRITGKDELVIADMCDASMTDAERKSMTRAIEAERREGVRFAICGLVTLAPDGSMIRQHIDQARPLMEIDEWSSSAWACLRTWFGELNGVSQADLGKSVRDARKIGAATSLARETQPPVAIAR